MPRRAIILAIVAMTASCGDFFMSGTLAHADNLFVVAPLLGDPAGNGLASNGPDSVPVSGAQGQQMAQPFKLTMQGTADSLDWYGIYVDATAPNSSKLFVIQVLADSAYVPGTVIEQQSVSAIGINTGTVDWLGRPVLAYSAPLSPTTIQVNTKFWLSIMENDASTLDSWAWFGAEPPPNPSIGLHAYRYDPSSEWELGGSPPNSRAFTLKGQFVPEPSSLGLSSLMGALAVLQRGRRRSPPR